MRKIWVAGGLGIAAGVIDVIPMLIMQTGFFSCASAFLHWVFLGIVITFVNWGMRSWLKGLILALAAAIPVVLMVYPVDPNGVIPILVISPLLGSVVGYLSERLTINIGQQIIAG